MLQFIPTTRRTPLTLTLLFLFSGCFTQPTTQPGVTTLETTPVTSSETAPPNPAPGDPQVITVAAAADLKFALEEVIKEYRRSFPAQDVRTVLGSSGNLYSQLLNDAPFDVYLSADIQYPRMLVTAGKAASANEFRYAYGHIVLWVSNSSPLELEKSGWNCLLDPSIRKIAIANPQHAPYGRAAEAALKSCGLYDRVKDFVVKGDNVAQTAQFIESGAADIGIIAKSLAVSPAMKDKGRFWEIPNEGYPPIEQAGIILRSTKQIRAAESFRDFLISESGRKILQNFGFSLP